MKTPEEVAKNQFNLRETDKEILRDCINKLQNLMDSPQVNENFVFDILAIKNDLDSMGESMMWRLLKLAKQNYQID